MRKYIIGFMVGAALTFALQAGASSLLDSKISAVIEVEVDGVNLGQAPVISGVSYLPVRKFGNATGYNVNFGEGKATLTSIEENKEVPVAPVEQPAQKPSSQYTLDEVNGKITALESSMQTTKDLVDSFDRVGRTDEIAESFRKDLKGFQDTLNELKAIKAQLEAQ